VEREKELASLEAEKRSFAEKRKKLEERFEKEREQLFGTVQADARRILAEWKGQRISHKQALKELAQARNSLIKNVETDGEDGETARPAVDLASLHIRQRLRHIPWKRVGVLQEVDLRKQRVRLDLDGVSLWADAVDIALSDAAPSGGKGKGEAKTEPARGFTGTASGVLPLRLDLRGMRADVAVSELEKFLDGAILQGRSEVEVVHGRGTGVLRRELHVFLRGFPAVASFHLAPEDRGGDGMTLVELK
jgi:DNA mismatch repair protein MutS2